MKYPAHIQKDSDGYTVSFRDIPEALTCGDSSEEALVNAQDALITAMEFYFEDRRSIPLPSSPKKDEHLIELPPSVYSKVFLLNELINQRITNAELARRMNIKPQEVQRIIDLSHNTKIDTLSSAISTLGKSLTVEVL